jgi:hypothetical protein
VAYIFKAFNGAMPTTSPLTKITTGTATKTLLQVAPQSSKDIACVGWGISFDGNAAGVSIQCELIETDVAATVTAHVSAGITSLNNPGGSVSQVQLGTALTGYTATSEGTIAAVRIGDYVQVQPTNSYVYDYILGYEFVVRAGKFLRVRVTAAAAVNAVCYAAWSE